jgi:hypothetical protein
LTVNPNSTATMIVGTTVKTISTGRLYCVWRGGVSSSPLRLRWNAIAQNIAPQVITPTTSAAIAEYVHRWRIDSACGVTPTGQPKRRTSSTEQPVVSGTTNAARPANLAPRPQPRRSLPRCARPTARRLPNPSSLVTRRGPRQRVPARAFDLA